MSVPVTQAALAPVTRPGVNKTPSVAIPKTKTAKKKIAPPPIAAKREAARKAPYHFALQLREATISNGVAKVCLISEGPGNAADGHFYPVATLEQAVKSRVFEGAQSYFDHPTSVEDKIQPERSVMKLAGWFANVQLGQVADEAGLERAAIVADFHPQSGNERVLELMRTAVDYASAYPTKSYIGFSINASGSSSSATINGLPYKRVDEITDVVSVDIVTRAGARGKLITFQEAARMGRSKTEGRVRNAPITKKFLTEAVAIRKSIKSGDADEARKAFLESIGVTREALGADLGDAGLDPKTLATLLDKVSDLGIKAAFGMDPDAATTSDEDDGADNEDDGGDIEDDVDDESKCPTCGAMTKEDDASEDDASEDDASEDDATEDDATEDDASEDDAEEDDVEAMPAPKMKKALQAARRESAKSAKTIKNLSRDLREAVTAKAAAENEVHKQLLERSAIRTLEELNVPATARPALLRKVRESATADTKLAVQRLLRDEWSLIKAAAGNDGAGNIARESDARGFVPTWKKG